MQLLDWTGEHSPLPVALLSSLAEVQVLLSAAGGENDASRLITLLKVPDGGANLSTRSYAVGAAGMFVGGIVGSPAAIRPGVVE